MPDFTAKIEIANNSNRPRIVWVELLAEDYTLLPSERLQITAKSSLEQPWFQIDEWQESTQVYFQPDDVEYGVTQNGTQLQPGHNRQAALDAGLQL